MKNDEIIKNKLLLDCFMLESKFLIIFDINNLNLLYDK